MSRSPVRARESGAWRLRPWPGNAGIGHLVFTDHAHLPTADEVGAALDIAHGRGARVVRTSALFPPAAAALTGFGFTTADRLALLQLEDLPHRQFAVPTHRTHPVWPWQWARVAEIDRAAFGAEWGNDVAGLTEIRQATPAHHARRAGAGRHGAAGFAISGLSGRAGYLQRLAVVPEARREGLATSLVADALRWMQARRADTVLVNTGLANTAALDLYARFGFVRLTEQLTIAEFRFGS